MLHQMSVPLCAPLGELAARASDARLVGDASSEASSDATEDSELPQCRIRRNYHCPKCTFFTQNPRAYLVHVRDVHFEKFKIYDCSYCVYASRHHQKLLRHIKMVHTGPNVDVPAKTAELPVDAVLDSADPMEDLMEQVEESEDMLMDAEDYIEELTETIIDHDMEGGQINADESAASDAPDAKGNFFSCSKCNYVTHIRARYTKHVKYHSMPMIKCPMCDFRTPYKWNLDRHLKNHGGGGRFPCSMCNFTADIKQSLTVHEMNHHLTRVGQSGAGRRRNRVGASDLPLPHDDASGDSHSSHSELGMHQIEKEIVSCNSDSNDAASDSAKKSDVSMHHQGSASVSPDESKNKRKAPRPIPQLIPLNASTPQNKASGEPPLKKIKETPSEELGIKLETSADNFTPIHMTNAKENTQRKKNESFFDRLKERILTETGEDGSLICKSCGFESKCLSEHSVHEKNCTAQLSKFATSSLLPNHGSTRCQYCRHRCKSSADLHVHMQSCRKNKAEDDQKPDASNTSSNETGTLDEDKEPEPHPMENVVFVWNNINREENSFETPLGISIHDDSTLPENSRVYDSEIVDDNECMNLSPSLAAGKKVFKCPHCPFWAATASRFHVHIVGHLNKKPFECSLCQYKSNWRWDITKHIKLKSTRDPEHNEAQVLMTDETGRRNYSKYNKYLAIFIYNENGPNEFHYVDSNAEADESLNDVSDMTFSADIQPLNLQTQLGDPREDYRLDDSKKIKTKTLWKCKRCNYKDSSKEALLEHVKEHSRPEGAPKPANKKPENAPDPADLVYSCGHCNQLSNWKHVIQRHCRLKHEGVVKVITTVKPKTEEPLTFPDAVSDICPKCPFKTDDKKMMSTHLEQHQPSPLSIFKCYFCQFFVKTEQELIHHITLHGIPDPEEFITKAMGSKSPVLDKLGLMTGVITATKRHKCTECPYETNSKSQYMYHEQFHRLPADTPYKCPECNYSVSKRHLLHQHLRVHGIITKKSDLDDADASCSKDDGKTEISSINLDLIPFVWVSAKDEFHKMYKCRFCSYVNSQENKIPNHEKIHCVETENSDLIVYKCWECKFTCDNALRLAEHSKAHGELYGRIYCPVETDVPDEEQIAKLRKVIEAEKAAAEEAPKEEGIINECRETKILFFCHKCPARFFVDDELKVHDKFHDSTLANKCRHCEFSVSAEDELITHNIVHTDEYHTKTKMLKFIHNSNASHRAPVLELVHNPKTLQINWIVSNPSKNYGLDFGNKKSTDTKHVPKQYFCKDCPAKFFKSSALSYHAALHGGDGEHKCKKCSYAVKNVGNLAKHELLHEHEGKANTCDYESGEDADYKNIPLSGTDLFQRKTEAQKRVLTDKDKLVKPNDHFPPVLQADPQFGYLMHGNPEFIYPTYLKNGRQKEKRYKCHKCPSAFEKREQYKIHLSLHGSKQRYKCELCDYSVKYYANYVQHMRKHQMNDEAQAERNKGSNEVESENQDSKPVDSVDNVKLAIKTIPKGAPKTDFQQFSISDQQTLRLLQHRRSMNMVHETAGGEAAPVKDRKLHMCLLCPYTNQRQDALTNHYKRHDDADVINASIHKCPFCDLVMAQTHFLREHLKSHFHYQKTLTPECFVANETLSFTITTLDDEETTTEIKLDMDFKPAMCNDEKVFVNIKTGELVGAD